MTLAYRNFSKNAAKAERLGNFTEAERFWTQATTLATGQNQQWATDRANFCKHAAKRHATH